MTSWSRERKVTDAQALQMSEFAILRKEKGSRGGHCCCGEIVARRFGIGFCCRLRGVVADCQPCDEAVLVSF